MTEHANDFWDRQAAVFDTEPDHGLLRPTVREAWRRLLLDVLPPAPADVVDLGCGTGSLAVLIAEAGYQVRGTDLSGPMVQAAKAKAKEAAAGADVEFTQGDAGRPPYASTSCDVVLVRHVLWALPNPSDAIARWVELLRPGGRLVLVEGHWHTGGGLTAEQTEALVREHRESVTIRSLDSAELWGGPVLDERYVVVSPS